MMPKPAVLVIVAGALLLLGAVWMRGRRTPVDSPTRGRETASIERFSPGPLDTVAWVPFRVGDFHSSAIEAVGFLRLAVDTRGTPPGTWKHLGVRRAAPIPIRDGTEISMILDGLEAADSSFLSASVVLSPHEMPGDPRNATDCVVISYVGAAPGARGKMAVETCDDGIRRTLLDAGRDVSRRKISINFQARGFRILENNEPVFSSTPGAFPFARAYLHLMLSSESNFPLREVHFDDVEIHLP